MSSLRQMGCGLLIVEALALIVPSMLGGCGAGRSSGSSSASLSEGKAITAFSFPEVAATAAIDESSRTISATLPYGTNVTALVAAFTTTGVRVSVGGTVQVSGTTANDFTVPQIYTVTAADGSTADYTVAVALASAPSSAKAITAFSITSPAATGIVDENARAISVMVPNGTAVTALVAAFTTTGVRVTVSGTVQVSGTTANDFTQPVAYLVAAEDGTTATYSATVTPCGSNTSLAGEKCACVSGFADCNGIVADGCEVSTMSDVQNCGGCNKPVAAVPNGTSGCRNGYPGIGQCNIGFMDCNMLVADGCEVNAATDPNNCGGCGRVVPSLPNGTAGCWNGSPALLACNSGFADCNKLMADGCEINVATDPKNCGLCGALCLGGTSCQSGKCV